MEANSFEKMNNTIKESFNQINRYCDRNSYSSEEEYSSGDFASSVSYELIEIVKILVEQTESLLNSVETLKAELSDARKDIRYLEKQVE